MVAQNTPAAALAALTADERTIIKTLVDYRYDIHSAAAALKLAAVDLLLWLQQPNIRTALDALQEVAEQALALRLLEARRAAIDLLENAARAAQTPLELRRAAAALARAVAGPVGRASQAVGRASRPPGQAPATSTGSPHPIANADSPHAANCSATAGPRDNPEPGSASGRARHTDDSAAAPEQCSTPNSRPASAADNQSHAASNPRYTPTAEKAAHSMTNHSSRAARLIRSAGSPAPPAAA